MWWPPVRISFEHYTRESPFAQEAAPPCETFGDLLERRSSELLDRLLMVVGQIRLAGPELLFLSKMDIRHFLHLLDKKTQSAIGRPEFAFHMFSFLVCSAAGGHSPHFYTSDIALAAVALIQLILESLHHRGSVHRRQRPAGFSPDAPVLRIVLSWP